MKKYGVIDLGSNSIRLVIYNVKENLGKKISKGDFVTLISTKKTAGLSGYVVDGKFSENGIEKASDILSEFLDRASVVGCDNVSVFATAVLRNCTNSKAAVKAIEKSVGVKIDLISGEEEALLDFIGATYSRSVKRATLVDIGGGSTELVAIKNNKPIDPVSIDMGCMSSYSNFVDLILPNTSERAEIKACLKTKLRRLDGSEAYENENILGVGGSIRAIAKLSAATRKSVKSAKVLSLEDIHYLSALSENDPSAFSHTAARATPDRLHTVSCALVILETLMEEFGSKSIRISKEGIREGYLIKNVLRA